MSMSARTQYEINESDNQVLEFSSTYLPCMKDPTCRLPSGKVIDPKPWGNGIARTSSTLVHELDLDVLDTASLVVSSASPSGFRKVANP